MPVKPEKFCFWVRPSHAGCRLPPAVHADLMTVFSSASVEVRCVPSVGATVLPAVKPPEAPPAPRETFDASQLSNRRSLRVAAAHRSGLVLRDEGLRDPS
jgi:hypothetical protein